MRNIAIIVLSVISAAAIVSGSILYQRHIDTKDALSASEKNISKLHENITQLEKENTSLQGQIKANDEQISELKTANKSIAKLENSVNIKDQKISDLQENIHTLEKNLQEEREVKTAAVNALQEKLQDSQSQIRYLEEEVAKGHHEIEELRKQLEKFEGQKSLAETKKTRLKSTHEALITDLKKEIERQEITINEFKDRISVTCVDRILFEFGKATITDEGEEVLQKVGEILSNVQGKRIRIVGHTDNIPIMTKSQYKFPTNWELSAARAAAVIRHFQDNMNLDPSMMEAVGRSFYDPIAGNKTDKGRAQNRRVEIIISPQLQ